MDPLSNTPVGPSQLGAYEIIREVGRGGMGVVYEARDLAGLRVALKIPNVDLQRAPEARYRFLNEMRLSARLQHPNIVQTLHGGEHGNVLYLAMEFVDGLSLQEIIAQRGRIPTKELVFIAVQIADALVAAHGHDPSIIHRDLKPGNIMLTRDGIAKVLDFGIAKALDASTSATTSPLGTLVYISPEQLEASGSTSASDVYSFGTLLFEALTGRPPFSASLSPARLINAICLETPPTLRDILGPATPSDLDQLICAMLDKLPGRRPTTVLVAQKLRQIGQLLDSRPIVGVATRAPVNDVARSPVPAVVDTVQLIEQLQHPPRRRPALAIATALPVLALVIISAYWLGGVETQPPVGRAGRSAGPDGELTPVGEVRTPSSTPDSSNPCAAALGLWYFNTLTTWSRAKYDFVGGVRDWSLSVESVDGCEVVATLTNRGRAYKRGSVRTKLTPHDGDLRLAATFVLPADDSSIKPDGKRVYQVTFRDDRVEGGWRFHSRTGPLLTVGVFSGGRKADVGTPPADPGSYGCATQCWVLCGSSSAANTCVASRCVPPNTAVTECGRPAPDFEPPFVIESILAKGVDGVRRDRFPLGKCLEAARALNGRWQIHEATGDPWALELRATGCDLAGTDQDGRSYEGAVDARGAWLISRSVDSPRPSALFGVLPVDAWGFMGWGPAFGTHSKGAPVAAYRG